MNPQSQSSVAVRLRAQGQLDDAVLVAAEREAQQQGLALGAALLAQEGLDTQAFAEAASESFGLPLFDLGAFDLHQSPRGLLKEAFLRKHQLLPLLRRGATLFVAIADPSDHRGLNEGKFHSGLTLAPMVVELHQLRRSLQTFLSKHSDALLAGLEEDPFEVLSGEEEPIEVSALDSAQNPEEAPV